MNTTVDIDQRLLAAATAAAGALWSPAPLEPAEPVTAASAAAVLPAGGSAFPGAAPVAACWALPSTGVPAGAGPVVWSCFDASAGLDPTAGFAASACGCS